MNTAWQVRANTQWVITACKATQVDACRLLSANYSLGHRCVSRPTELSAVPLSWLCGSLWLGSNWDERRAGVGGLRGNPLHCVRLTDQGTLRRQGGEHQHCSPCSAAATGHFQDLEKIRKSDSICFLSLFSGESKGKTFPAVLPDWVWLT